MLLSTSFRRVLGVNRLAVSGLIIQISEVTGAKIMPADTQRRCAGIRNSSTSWGDSYTVPRDSLPGIYYTRYPKLTRRESVNGNTLTKFQTNVTLWYFSQFKDTAPTWSLCPISQKSIWPIKKFACPYPGKDFVWFDRMDFSVRFDQFLIFANGIAEFRQVYVFRCNQSKETTRECLGIRPVAARIFCFTTRGSRRCDTSLRAARYLTPTSYSR